MRGKERPTRPGAKPAKAKVNATLHVGDNSRQERRLERGELEKRLAEALEQQTATAEILRVISRSQTDVQPVFQAVIENAVRLCGGVFGRVFRRQGQTIGLAANQNFPDDARDFPRPLHDDETLGGRVARTGQVIRSADVETDPSIPATGLAAFRARRVRSVLVVPIAQQGETLGSIVVGHADVAAFSDAHVAMLQTFADQAVIAIENVRLFTELQGKNQALTQAHAQVMESLDQQTATSEILRVIASSPTDVQPIFDAIVRNASQLCGGEYAIVTRYDGTLLHLAALSNPRPGTAEETATFFPQPPRREESPTARALVDAQVIHIADVDAEELGPSLRERYRRIRLRAVVAVPMLHEGHPIGVISVSRETPGPFSDRQIALLKTFADQAVIAIENVRLFKELQVRNADLTEALEQQTSTAEILRAISRSPTNLQPVLDTIARNAVLVCDAVDAMVQLREGELIRIVAHFGPIARSVPHTRVLARTYATGRAILDREPFQIRDIEAPEADEFDQYRDAARQANYRTLIAVPLLREGVAIGALTIRRRKPQPFTDKQTALLQTFADQAVIAIENVRLFNELGTANRELQAASQHKSEFLANMSHELRTPLNAVIGFSEVLTERMFGELNEKQDEYLRDIYASGQHLLSLINDILDLSKIEAGRMELELADFHLPHALDNALVLVRERALRRGIALEQAIDSRLGEIRGDERKVKQVMLNLLSNAIKFTPDGGRINVRAVSRDSFVEVSISDTGVGIAPEDQAAIFEEFRQVGTAAKKVEGTGLGLTLSRKFIELHGGRIWVESEVGVGSTFTFTIPVRVGT